MTTAAEVIQDALAELTVSASERTIPPSEMNTCIRYMNRMMAAFDVMGIKLGYTVVKAPNDKLTVSDGAIEGIVFNLAVRMASSYDISITPTLAMAAQGSMKTLIRIGSDFPKANFPSTLPIGSGNYDGTGSYDSQAFFPGCCEDVDSCGNSNSNGDTNGL